MAPRPTERRRSTFDAAPAAAPGSPPVFVVAGGRVGVGASTIAAALATSFATTHRTLLVDADEGANALHRILGMSAARTADDLLRGVAPERVLTPAASHLMLIAGRDPSLPALSSAQRRTLFQRIAALYGRFEAVVVDAGSRATSVLGACAAPRATMLVVTTGDRIAAAGAYAIEKLLHLEHPGVPVALIGNLQNDADAFATRELVSGASEQFLGRPLDYAGTIPVDPSLITLLGGRSPAAGDGTPAVSPALMAITEFGTRALAAAGAPAVDPTPFPSTVRTHHGTR
jgi:flagellar biosynthesis protein FlhG